MKTTFATIISGLLLASSLLGQSKSEKPVSDSQWMAGLGVRYQSNPIKGADSSVIPLPVLFYKGDRLFFEYTTLGYKFYKGDWATVSAIVKPHLGDSWDADDSGYLSGMDDRKMTIDTGLKVDIDAGPVDIKAELLFDILDEHGGLIGGISVGKNYFIKPFNINPSIGINYRSANTSDYYYGVRAKEARANRPAYSLDSTISYEAKTNFRYSISRSWSIFFGLGAELLDSEIKDSPIIEDDYIVSSTLGFAYRF